MSSQPTNIVIAGLGGQGVIKASDILADVAFSAGLDVKKSELHGMSQRGGSVSSDVRFGERVFSPMVPEGEADFLVVIAPDQIDVNIAALKPGGILIEPSRIDEAKLPNKKSINVALLGALSCYLQFSAEAWVVALKRNLPEKLHEANLAAFSMGRKMEQE
ncbi:MAG: indolepyruvate oxidoreductase subunit beta [Terracidiphilus sp.]|jgi:indolepyruvate ferredoxin oxidoreductase beta subunit